MKTETHNVEPQASKAEHTPGPWSKRKDIDGKHFIFDAKGRIIAETSPVSSFDLCDDSPIAPRTGEANARLIAAAPETAKQRDELLAALKLLSALLDGVREDQISQDLNFGKNAAERRENFDKLAGFIRENCGELDNALEEARAAIARAEKGGS